MLGLDLGVYGAGNLPSSTAGIIRYRYAGDLNARVWESELENRCGTDTAGRRRNETVPSVW